MNDMYKALIWQDRVAVGNNIQTRCYVFEFDTKEGVNECCKFFAEHGASTKWVRDSKE